MAATDPVDDKALSTAPRLAIAPAWTDPKTGAVYVHEDLHLALDPWKYEEHIPPPKASEHFGDVPSWVDYVKRFSSAGEFAPFLSWNPTGLKAVLDYHSNSEHGGRLQWTASYPFTHSIEWQAWTELADGDPVSQREAIETLEDLAEDIVDPPAAKLMEILRSLRTAVNSKSDAELRPDGTTNIKFEQNKTVRGAGGGEVELPAELTIRIPILKGHTTSDGKPVRYELKVRLRTSVGDDGRLGLRFTIPTAERALELVYADRVEAARELLGSEYALLRAAG